MLRVGAGGRAAAAVMPRSGIDPGVSARLYAAAASSKGAAAASKLLLAEQHCQSENPCRSKICSLSHLMSTHRGCTVLRESITIWQSTKPR